MIHESAYAVQNPETGRYAYPATTPDGYPVLADGSIEGCDCLACDDRREQDFDEDESQPTQPASFCVGTERCERCGATVEIWTSQGGGYSVRIDPGGDGFEHGC